MDQLVCPKCNRDYELPRRYFVRLDDIEFQKAPRLLNCLHTCCQSCLEEMHQRNNTISCPQCRHEQSPSSVRLVPYDAAALAQLIPLDGSSLAHCSRCHDEVTSYSWCNECSVSLCEFHHQDHKLSYTTSKHEVMTFKEISQKRIHIEPRLPPVACVEELEQDASFYCHQCCIPVSAEATLTRHAEHEYSPLTECIEAAQDAIKSHREATEAAEKTLLLAMKAVRNTMLRLNEETEETAASIETTFSNLRTLIASREAALLKRLDDIATRKRQVLTTQLDAMTRALESCRHALTVSESQLAQAKVRGGDHYIVAAEKVICDRLDVVAEDIARLPHTPQADPSITARFHAPEIETLNTIVTALGALHTSDFPPQIDTSPTPNSSEISSPVPAIAFTIELGYRYTPYDVLTGSRNAPKLSRDHSSVVGKESVVIEVRTAQKHKSPTEGTLLGRVVVLTEVDRRYFPKHRVLSTYESSTADHLPMLRVTREVCAQ